MSKRIPRAILRFAFDFLTDPIQVDSLIFMRCDAGPYFGRRLAQPRHPVRVDALLRAGAAFGAVQPLKQLCRLVCPSARSQ